MERARGAAAVDRGGARGQRLRTGRCVRLMRRTTRSPSCAHGEPGHYSVTSRLTRSKDSGMRREGDRRMPERPGTDTT